MKVFTNKKKMRGYREIPLYSAFHYSGCDICLLSTVWMGIRVF